ncbi:hypothetical protein C2E23DRAFT_801765 [Lenzites betulinus]|nr:hypothetical protein C2E23DRAFT_801765 [Lenzites betulinus]
MADPESAPTIHPDFSSPNDDVVLRSSDGKLFRTSSDALCRSSAFFKTMLSLPQAPDKDHTVPISMVETADALLYILSIANARELPPLDGVSVIEDLLAAGEKYEMPMAISVARLAFSSRVVKIHPVRLYGIGCCRMWEKEAQEAASRTLGMNLLDPEVQTELSLIAPVHRAMLLDLHRRRRDILFAVLNNEDVFYANIPRGLCHYGPAEGVHDAGEPRQLVRLQILVDAAVVGTSNGHGARRRILLRNRVLVDVR